MYTDAKLMIINLLTNMHAGTGSELGIVDMPIQREKTTGFPKIEGSSLKGALRHCFFNNSGKIEINGKEININDEELLNHVFGPDADVSDEKSYAGATGFADAKILLFPVKSAKNVFGYITCPLVLNKFAFIIKKINNNTFRNLINKIENINIQDSEKKLNAICKNNSSLIIRKGNENKVILEEFLFNVSDNEEIYQFFNKLGESLENYLDELIINKIKNDVVIVSDEVFKNIVTNYTEVLTRTRIDPETGVVVYKSLFTEEFLLENTIMYSILFASPIFNHDIKIENNNIENKKTAIFYTDNKPDSKKVLEYFQKGLPQLVQIGGDATIGKGLTTIKIVD